MLAGWVRDLIRPVCCSSSGGSADVGTVSHSVGIAERPNVDQVALPALYQDSFDTGETGAKLWSVVHSDNDSAALVQIAVGLIVFQLSGEDRSIPSCASACANEGVEVMSPVTIRVETQSLPT